MPNDDLLKILFDTKIELEKTLNLSHEEIKEEALLYFKKNKKRIFETFIENKKDKKQLCLSAGASGAGKSEFVKILNAQRQLNIIDTDEIRKLFPYYSGENADLFQQASIKTVEYLIDNCF
ncbi:MAG: zeta toxin family protein [Sulfurovum sp.]|nr:zeta toxin family protein [Sulfurovum sp.]